MKYAVDWAKAVGDATLSYRDCITSTARFQASSIDDLVDPKDAPQTIRKQLLLLAKGGGTPSVKQLTSWKRRKNSKLCSQGDVDSTMLLEALHDYMQDNSFDDPDDEGVSWAKSLRNKSGWETTSMGDIWSCVKFLVVTQTSSTV